MLCANEAWAYAVLGDAGQAAGSLQRSADELSRADPSRAAPWVQFFGEVDLGALTGMVHLELSVADRRRAETARAALGTALAARTDDMARSRAFEQTALATAAFRDGDLEEGVRIGRSAAGIAASLRSARVSDRLKPLVVASRAASARSSDAGELAEVLVGQIAG